MDANQHYFEPMRGRDDRGDPFPLLNVACAFSAFAPQSMGDFWLIPDFSKLFFEGFANVIARL
jgi:hypothetical protein